MRYMLYYSCIAMILTTCTSNKDEKKDRIIIHNSENVELPIIVITSHEDITQLRKLELLYTKDTSYTRVDTIRTKKAGQLKIVGNQIRLDSSTIGLKGDTALIWTYPVTHEANSKLKENYEVQFVRSFNNDRVRIFEKGSLIWEDTVNTMWNTGYAQHTMLKRSYGNLIIEINDTLVAKLQLPENYNYLYIYSNGIHDTLKFDYTYIRRRLH